MASESLAALTGIGGTLVGGGLALLGERLRRSSDRKDRDSALLRELSAGFAVAAVRVSDATWDLWHSRYENGGIGRPTLSDPETAAKAERDSWPQLMTAYFTLRVAAPVPLVEAAELLYEHVKRYSERTADSTDDRCAWLKEWRQLRSLFLEEARRSAGIGDASAAARRPRAPDPKP
jgi:hypothetical protein